MNRTFRLAGLVLASLTISTVAMAQQGGGNGGGGNGGGNGSGGGDTSVLELLREDAANPRLTRAIAPRRSPNCLSHVCEQPPGDQYPPRGRIAQFDASCSGGEMLILRGRDGQAVRYLCRNL